MKVAMLVIIVVLSYLAIKMFIPPIPLLVLYGFLAIIPLVIIFLKKNLLNGLLLWFFLVLFPSFGVNIHLRLLPDLPLQRILWVALVLIFLAEIAMKERKFVRGDIRIEIAMSLLCIYIIFSMILSGSVFKEGHGLFISTFLSSYFIPFSIFFLTKNIVDNEHKIKKVFIFFVIIGFYLGITGIFEHFKVSSLVFPRYIMNPRVGIHFGLARGPFVQAAVNGTVLCMIFFIAIYLLFHTNRVWMKFFLSVTCAFLVITLFFTYNRASWLAFLFSSLFIPVFFPQMRKVFIISFLAVMLLFGFSKLNLVETKRVTERVKSENPIYDRINLYGAAWWMFLEKPVFGFGYNTFRKHSPQYVHPIKGIPYRGWEKKIGIHDTWAGILVELGLVGLGLFMFIILNIMKVALGLYHRLPAGSFLGKGLVAGFIGIFFAYLIELQFIEMRYFMFPNSLFFLMAGIMVGLNQRVELNNTRIRET